MAGTNVLGSAFARRAERGINGLRAINGRFVWQRANFAFISVWGLVARQKGLAVTGTLGILDMAARRGLLDLAEAFGRLRNTTFRCPEDIMARLLETYKREG